MKLGGGHVAPPVGPATPCRNGASATGVVVPFRTQPGGWSSGIDNEAVAIPLPARQRHLLSAFDDRPRPQPLWSGEGRSSRRPFSPFLDHPQVARAAIRAGPSGPRLRSFWLVTSTYTNRRSRLDRPLRHQQSLVRIARRQADSDEQAGQQQPVRVGQGRSMGGVCLSSGSRRLPTKSTSARREKTLLVGNRYRRPGAPCPWALPSPWTIVLRRRKSGPFIDVERDVHRLWGR